CAGVGSPTATATVAAAVAVRVARRARIGGGAGVDDRGARRAGVAGRGVAARAAAALPAGLGVTGADHQQAEREQSDDPRLHRTSSPGDSCDTRIRLHTTVPPRNCSIALSLPELPIFTISSQ